MRIHLLDHFFELQDSPNWGKKYENWIEPQKYTDIMVKNPLLRPSIPIWLPQRSFALTTIYTPIIKAFQNPIWSEQLRERLKQIYLLTKASTQPSPAKSWV